MTNSYRDPESWFWRHRSLWEGAGCHAHVSTHDLAGSPTQVGAFQKTQTFEISERAEDSALCTYVSKALMFSLSDGSDERPRYPLPRQGNEWLVPVCSDGPESCPLVSWPRSTWQGHRGLWLCPQPVVNRPQSSLWVLGVWMSANGRGRSRGAHHRRRWPWVALTQPKLRLMSESFQADSRLKWNKINK